MGAWLPSGAGTRYRHRVYFFKWEELENFQSADYHQRRLPVTFFSPSFEFLMNQKRCRLSSITNQLMRENCFWMWLVAHVWREVGVLRHETVASDNSQEFTRSLSPRHLHPQPSAFLDSDRRAFCIFITTLPCLINDTANVTSNHKTLCAGDNYASALCDKLCRPRGEKRSDYVIDIYLDRMKVL